MIDSPRSDQLELEFPVTGNLASARFKYVHKSCFTGSRKMKRVDGRREKVSP